MDQVALHESRCSAALNLGAAAPSTMTRPMCRTGRHKNLCRVRVLVVMAGLSAGRFLFFKTPPKHAAEPCDLRSMSSGAAPRSMKGLPSTMTRPMCRTGRHKKLCRLRVLLIKAGLSAGRFVFLNAHQNMRWSRVTVPADLEPSKESGLGVGLSQGSGWSGSTCEV